jgi:hypothetical protein
MKESQQPCHGKATPQPLHVRLAKGVLEGRRIGHGAACAIDKEGAMTRPPPVVRGRSQHRAAEALQQEVKETQRESGAGLAGGRRAAPYAREAANGGRRCGQAASAAGKAARW